MGAGTSQSRVSELASQHRDRRDRCVPFFQDEEASQPRFRPAPVRHPLNSHFHSSQHSQLRSLSELTRSEMGITDFFSDLVSSFGLAEAQAEAPPAEQNDESVAEQKDEKSEESNEPAEESSEQSEEQTEAEPEAEGDAEAEESEGGEEEEGEDEEEEEEEEEEEAEDIKPKLEEGKSSN